MVFRTFVYIILILLGLGIYIGCHTIFSGKPGYEVKRNKVNYKFRKHYDNPWMHSQWVEHVHLPSFTIINAAYAKDRYRVYFRGKALENSDPESFEMLAIDQTLDKDKNQVYYWGDILSKDAKSFEGLDKHYYRDANHVWFKKKHPDFLHRWQFIKLTATEASSFEIMRKGGFLTRTQTQVFYFEKEIPEVNPKQIKTLGGGYWTDQNTIYYQETSLAFIEVASFETIKHPQGYFTLFAKDKEQVIYAGKLLEGIKAATFQIVKNEGHFMGFDGHQYVSMGGTLQR